MQWILLAALSLAFALSTVFLTQKWSNVRRTRRASVILVLICFLLNAAGTVVIEGIYKAGRPTFFYHLHSPGTVTLKFFISGCALAAISACVLIDLFERKIQKKQPTAHYYWTFSRIATFSLLIASILELGLFNMRHYELIGSEKPGIVFERGSYWAQGFYFNRASQKFTSYPNNTYNVTIYPGQVKVRNILLNMDSGQPQTRIRVGYTDETFEFPIELQDHILDIQIPESCSIPLHTVGTTYMFQIQFPDVTPDKSVEFSIPSVAINQVVPLKISLIRFLLSAAMTLLLFTFWPGSIFYSIRLNLRSFRQRAVIALLIIIFCGWFAWTTFSSYTGSSASFTEQKAKLSQSYQQYNQLVDALLVPRYALLEKPNKDILNAERPYDKTYRDHYNIFYAWDTALYQGAYYVYFGVVPAAMVLLPWKLITGIDMELDYASLLFCCLGLIGLYGLYACLISKAFPRTPFLFYLMGFIILASVLNLTWCLRRGLVYELAICSGFCFIVWAVFLTFQAWNVRRLRNWFLLGGGLAAALAVGCRPTLLLVSILFPFLIIRGMKQDGKLLQRQHLWNLLSFLVPYALIGLLLMKYNYERFGSIFEFGIHYQLTEANESVSWIRTGIWGTTLAILHYLWTPLTIRMDFPFLHLSEIQIPYNGFLLHTKETIGLFSFPIFWLLFLTGKFRKRLQIKGLWTFYILCLMIGFLLCAACSQFSVVTRYMVDFAWLFAIPAILVLFCVQEQFEEKGLKQYAEGAAVVCMTVGIAIFAAISVTGEDNWFQKINPVYFEQLVYQFEFWK